MGDTSESGHAVVEPAAVAWPGSNWHRSEVERRAVRSVRPLIRRQSAERSRHWKITKPSDAGLHGYGVQAAVAHALQPLTLVPPTPQDVAALMNAKPYQPATIWSAVEAARCGSIGAALQGYGIADYRRVETATDLMRAICQLGPVIAGFDWFECMRDPDGYGRVRAAGERLGQHAICVSGYADGFFRCVNSWGVGWGQSGRFWLPFDDMGRLIADGEACVLLGR